MAFEIGPRTNVFRDFIPDQPAMPAHFAEIHKRVINGTAYAFGRRTFDSGVVTVQAVKLKEASPSNPDVHWWTNSEVAQ